MYMTTLGIDLAKHTLSLCDVDHHGKTMLRKTLSRVKLMPFLGQPAVPYQHGDLFRRSLLGLGSIAAWLGLTPWQHTTDGVIRLGCISKKGNIYLRTLLIHVTHAVLATLKDKQDRLSPWTEAGLNGAIISGHRAPGRQEYAHRVGADGVICNLPTENGFVNAHNRIIVRRCTTESLPTPSMR